MDSIRNESDPRTRQWLMVNDSPFHVWMCSAAYLVFVWIGPKIMQRRAPFELRTFMVFYNAMLVALSAYIVFEIWSSVYENDYNLLCQPFDVNEAHTIPSEMRIAKVISGTVSRGEGEQGGSASRRLIIMLSCCRRCGGTSSPSSSSSSIQYSWCYARKMIRSHSSTSSITYPCSTSGGFPSNSSLAGSRGSQLPVTR